MAKQNFKLTKSPFKDDKNKPSIFISNGDSPYQNTLNALSNIDLSCAKGKKVLLKPNIGRMAKPGDGITTNPDVVAAAIDAFREVGADVSIGESPITGIKTMEAFEITGVTKIAKERNCPLIDMDARPYVETLLPEGIAIQSLKLCPEILEFDIIVSIPVIKMHMHTGVTLSMKNMKGCLWRRSKVELHMLPPVPNIDEKSINVAIADMSWALRPHLSIVDGSTCMEGMGPSAGNPKELGLVLVGIEPFSTDAVACELMGTSATKVPYLYLAAERGYGNIDIDKISIYPNNWRDMKKIFKLPPSNFAINYPGISILDKNSCSACQSTLMLFLKEYGDKISDYFPDSKNINFAIGKGHDTVPKNTVCVGNCTFKNKKDNIFIKGCPPVSSEILKSITGKTKI